MRDVMRVRAPLIVLCSLVATGATASEPARTVTVAPGSRYEAGWLHGFFLGAHWRDAWTTPVTVPVLDLETFDGGLRPDREGGGLETTNLHFKSGNGHTWAFRSVDKDPTRVLDPDTRASLIGDLAQDQTSSAHPFGALVVPPLLDVAGVLHATPQILVLPDDPRLGPFREHAGMMGLMEERIERGLAREHKIADTIELLKRLERRSDESVDARSYLRARLVDILVGDWDRHLAQWRWARFDDGPGRSWRPIPRDRDQALSRFDGVVPFVAEYYTKPLAGFGPGYAPIDKLTFAGASIDRRFLVPLDRAAWEAVADDLAARLTDAVISEAVHRLPPPTYAHGGEEIERCLRARRDALPAAARDFYRLLAGEVDVRGTEAGEDFRVDRKPGGAVEVAVYARSADEGEAARVPFFHRTFLPDETSEIRLYTMGGADRILVEGTADRSIPVHVVAPERRVAVEDGSSRSSSLDVHEPLPDDPPSPFDVERLGAEQAGELSHYEPFRDWGRDWLFFPQLSYDGSRGLVFGGYMQRTGYGFELDPRASVMNFGAAWSTGTSQPRLEYSADLRTRTALRGLVYLAYSGMDQAKYFGVGNETPRDSGLASSGFYDVTQRQFTANALLDVSVAGPLHARAGALFQHALSVDHSGIFATARPEGADGLSLLSPEVGVHLDTRGGTFTDRRGFAVDVMGRYTPSIFGNPAAFTKLRGEISGSIGGHLLTDVLLSLRVAGESNWGSYPYFESAFLGGSAYGGVLDVTGTSRGNVLRGYDLNRFAGDAAFVANAELAIALGRVRTVVPLRYGLVGLADLGRVFLEGESSSKWHTGYGGGVWLGMFASGTTFQLATAVKATVVHSEEGTAFYLASAFSF
jgi:hypothetical protein